jgi:hypothetical protein
LNGKLAGYTEVPFQSMSRVLPVATYDVTAQTFFNNLDFNEFDGRWTEGWTHVYCIDLELVEGENVITIYAANSARTEGTGTDNDNYDTTNNPCGIIFACVVPGDVFENTLFVPKSTTITINKWYRAIGAICDDDVFTFGIVADTNGDDRSEDEVLMVDQDGNTILFVSDENGVASITFDDGLPAGTYWVREVLTEEQLALYQQPGDLKFIVDAEGNVVFEGDIDYIVNQPHDYPKYEFRVVTSTEDPTAYNSWKLGNELTEEHPLGSGVDVKDVWNAALTTGTLEVLSLDEILDAIQTIVDNANAGQWTWTWGIALGETTAGNRDGDIWNTFARSFYVGDTIVDDAAWIYFGADDAVIVEINGEIVAWSYNVLGFDKSNLAIQYPLGEFQGNLQSGGFTMYSVNLAEYLNTNAANTIRIIAMNQDVPPNEPLSDATSLGNPCGILLAFEVRSYDGSVNPWA